MSMSTICAPATAPGGAIGIIRISGPEAIATANAIFSRDISNAKGYTMHYGQIMGIDDVILSVCRAPHSYTGEDTVEISHHGSAYIQQRILEQLIQHGAHMAQAGEFTQRAFLNGKMDLSQAEAVADLIASRNAATHQMALHQLRGGFSRDLEQLRSHLLRLTSLLELELDFSEEEVEFADRRELSQLCDTIQSHIQHLTDSFQTGNALKNGIPVAIIGAPNVGKSTLLNALLHDDRAIVSDIQGTTRDLIEDTITLQGVTFRFIDTAGIRQTEDRIEQLGIERSLQAVKRAQIIILLTDNDRVFPEDVEIPDGKTVFRVVNKADLYYPASSYVYNRRTQDGYYYISSLYGTGIDMLQADLIAAARLPEFTEGDTVVTNLRHYEALSLALQDIQRVSQAFRAPIPVPGDLIAQDLRQCLFHLAEITGGQITSDEVLGTIFKHFCIGK